MVRVLVVVLLLATTVAAGADEAKTYTLPELTVDAERADLGSSLPFTVEQPGSLTLKLKYAPTPNEALRLNPSVSINVSMKGVGGAPSIRGLPNYSNQILLNGTPVNMPWANWSNLTTFPLRRLANISVTTGGAALLHGSNGLGGAINMTLPTAADLEGLTLRQEVGNQGVNHQEVIYGRVAHNNQHLFAFTTDFTRGWQRHAERDNETFLYRGEVRTDSGWKFKFDVMDVKGRMDLPDYGDRTMTPQTWDPWTIKHRDLIVEKNFGEQRQLTLRTYNNWERSNSVDYADTTYSRITGQGYMDMSVKGSEVLYNLTLGKHRVAAGISQSSATQEGQSVGSVARELKQTGFMLSDLLSLGDRLDLHLIGRKDKQNVAGDESSWAAHATWKPASRWRVYAGTSKMVRFPTMRELYMTFLGRQIPNPKNQNQLIWQASIPGQGDLTNRPETSRTVEGAVEYRFSDTWNLRVGRFSTRADGLITQVPNPRWPQQNPRFWWRNLNRAEFAGWETRLQGTLNRTCSLWLGHTRLEEADDSTTGVRIDERPFYRLTGGFVYDRHPWQAMLSVDRRGRAPYLQTGGAAPVNAEIEASTRLDLSLRYQLTSLAQLSLQIDNVLDADCEINSHVFGAPTIDDTPRRAVLGLECQF